MEARAPSLLTLLAITWLDAREVGANAIRLVHDEVVCILAKLFRSLRVDAIVEPLRIFSDAAPASADQRPDILLRGIRD